MGVSVRKETRVTYVEERNDDLIVQQRGHDPGLFEVMVPKNWVSEDGTVLLTVGNLEMLSKFLTLVTNEILGVKVDKTD